MSDNRILFLSQEISPYVPANEVSDLGHTIPQAMQEKGYEVRIFMPKYGPVNERRNQLHEVIRLSGVNIPIDDNDHPLIIKVASMQPGRIQVYFIDNDDFFQKSAEDIDPVGSNRSDNDERAIFFARGTMETVKKLRWEPSIIHCTGWISSLAPIYLRKMYSDDPSFLRAKIVYSINDRTLGAPLDPRIYDKMVFDGMNSEDVESFRSEPNDTNALHKIAIDYSDAVIFETDNVDPELVKRIEKRKIPYLTKQQINEDLGAYDKFYQTLFSDEK